MKKFIIAFQLTIIHIVVYAQLKVRVDIPSNSNVENNQSLKYNKKLIRTSCHLPFYVKDSVTETDIAKALALTPSSCYASVVLFKDDTTRLAISIQNEKRKYEVTSYWRNGNTRRIGLYNKNRFETRSVSEYYVSGGMKSKGHYLYGKKNGKWKQYNPNGILSTVS